MPSDKIAELELLLNSSAESLPNVTSKKMFGCHALWVKENVFALVWKHGRIGFKLPEESSYATLMKKTGAEPWKAGPMQMSHWVLIPEAFHRKPSEIKRWAIQAHRQCAELEKKPVKTKPKASVKVKSKIAPKKVVSRKK